MRYALSTAVLVFGVLANGIASAATVDVIKGEVSINRGEGFELLNGPSSAKAGDAIMASPEASAQIVYSDQCKVKVEPGAVVVVTRETPCKVVVEGEYEPTGGSLKDEPAPVVEDYTPYYILGGLAVAGGVACAIACGNDDDDDDDASP